MADPFAHAHARRLPLFAHLSPEQVDAVAGAFQEAKYVSGDVLFRQGDVAQAFYLFVSGAARILQTGPDGIERALGDVHPGESVGEESLFLTERNSTSVQATQESIVLVLSRASFDAVLDAHPDIRPLLNIRKDMLDALQAQRERGIRPDEITLLLTRRHPWAFAGRALRSVILCAVLAGAAILFTQARELTPFAPLALLGLAIVVPGMLGVYYFFEWRNDYFTVTSQRVVHDERYLLTGQERREQVLLGSVQSVNVSRRGPIAEVIGFGDVVISIMGHQQPLVLDMIPAPMRVQQMIFEQVQRHTPQPANGSSVGAGSTPIPPISPQRKPGLFSQIVQAMWPRMRFVEGDRITYRKHWIILVRSLWKPTLAYALLAALIIIRLAGRFVLLQSVPSLVFWGLALVWLALNSFWWYWQYADWYNDLYIVDNQSIIDIKRRPLWLREVRIQAGLQQIQNVTSQILSVWGRMFNYGDVIIQTAAEHGTMVFAAVHDPTGVAEEVLQRVQRHSEARASAGQADQQRLVAQYLANYQQAAGRETPQAPQPPPAVGERTQPMIWRSPRVPAMKPPTTPTPSPEQPSTASPTASSAPPLPTMPGQLPEMPPDTDQTQASTPATDTQPIQPPKPPAP